MFLTGLPGFYPVEIFGLVNVKTEIALVRIFRLILPTAFLAIAFWTFEISPDGQQAVLSYLAGGARHLLFFAALGVTVFLYVFMGAYERRIFFENRQHARNMFVKRLED